MKLREASEHTSEAGRDMHHLSAVEERDRAEVDMAHAGVPGGQHAKGRRVTDRDVVTCKSGNRYKWDKVAGKYRHVGVAAFARQSADSVSQPTVGNPPPLRGVRSAIDGAPAAGGKNGK